MIAGGVLVGQHSFPKVLRSVESVAMSAVQDSTSDADLSCLEEGGWEKDSPASSVRPAPRVDMRPSVPSYPPERAPLRRSRPGQSNSCGGGLREEKIDVLEKMLRAQGKFQPRVDPSKGGRALCHSVSPFVAERRRWFVAWKVSNYGVLFPYDRGAQRSAFAWLPFVCMLLSTVHFHGRHFLSLTLFLARTDSVFFTFRASRCWVPRSRVYGGFWYPSVRAMRVGPCCVLLQHPSSCHLPRI